MVGDERVDAMYIPDLKEKLHYLYQRSDRINNHDALGEYLKLKGRGSNIRTWISGHETRGANLVPDKHIKRIAAVFNVSVTLLQERDLERFKQALAPAMVESAQPDSATAMAAPVKIAPSRVIPYYGLLVLLLVVIVLVMVMPPRAVDAQDRAFKEEDITIWLAEETEMFARLKQYADNTRWNNLQQALDKLKAPGDGDPSVMITLLRSLKRDPTHQTYKNMTQHWLALGDMAFLVSEFDQAIEHYQRADLITSYWLHRYQLAKVYLRQDNYPQACNLFYGILEDELWIQETRTKAAQQIELYRYLGACEEGQDHLDQAMMQQLRAQALGQQVDIDRVIQARTLNSIGRIHYLLSQYPQAQQHFSAALKLAKDQKGARFDVGIYWNNLANAQTALTLPEEAKASYQRALSSLEAAYGHSEHPVFAMVYTGLASVQMDLSDYQAANQSLAKALALDLAIYAKDHPNIATRLNELGRLWLKLDRPDEAQICYLKSLELNRAHFGETHRRTALSYLNLGIALYRLGRFERALAYFNDAKRRFVAVYDSDHPNTRLAQEWIEAAQVKLSNPPQRPISSADPIRGDFMACSDDVM